MPYGFCMQHDGFIVKSEFEDDAVWQTLRPKVGALSTPNVDGKPIDLDVLGTVRFKITSSHQDLEPMFPTKHRNAVSAEIREFIESIEPGVHQFIPTDINLQDGSKASGQYYLVNICNQLDAVDDVRSELNKSVYSNVYISVGNPNDRFILRQDVVGEKSLWIDSRVVGVEFMSDQLHDAITSSNSSRLAFIKAEFS